VPRTGRRRHIDRARWRQLHTVAIHFAEAAGVLLVHAAIAPTDAITVKVGGVKSVGEDHTLAADLLEMIVAADAAGKKAINHLRALIQEKNLVSYSGEIYRHDDIRRMARHLARYRTWADRLLTA
jgi:hypothetical protein